MTITSNAASAPQRRRHRDPLRHPRRRQAAPPAAQVPVPGPQRVGQRHAQPLDDPRLLRRRRGAQPTSASSSSTPTTPRCWSGRTTGRPRSSSSCTRSPSCLTAGLANIAAARKVTLTEVRSTVTGDIDLNGILGLDRDVRNGYQQIDGRVRRQGRRAAEEILREIVEQSRHALGRLRRHHQRRAGRHRRRGRLISRRHEFVSGCPRASSPRLPRHAARRGGIGWKTRLGKEERP